MWWRITGTSFVKYDYYKRVLDKIEYICPKDNITFKEGNYDKDYVHILFESHPNSQISKFINRYKSASSRLLKKFLNSTKIIKNTFGDRAFACQRQGFQKFNSNHKSQNSYTTNLINGNIKLQDRFLKLPKIGKVEVK